MPKCPKETEPVAFVQKSIRKPKTASARRFDKYKVARTLQEAKALGATAGDLQYDVARGVLHRAESLRNWSILRTIQLFAPSDKRKIAFAPNLKRVKSKAYNRYEAYSKARTLEEAKKMGIWPGDVANDLQRGLLGTPKSPFAEMGLKVVKRLGKKIGSGKAKGKADKATKASSKRTCEGKSCSAKKTEIEGTSQTGSNRNSQRRSARTEARVAWQALGCDKASPVAWSRKNGWTVDGSSCKWTGKRGWKVVEGTLKDGTSKA